MTICVSARHAKPCTVAAIHKNVKATEGRRSKSKMGDEGSEMPKKSQRYSEEDDSSASTSLSFSTMSSMTKMVLFSHVVSYFLLAELPAVTKAVSSLHVFGLVAESRATDVVRPNSYLKFFKRLIISVL